MADITISPHRDGQRIEIENDAGDTMAVWPEEAIALLENGKAEGWSFRVELRSYGRRLDWQVVEKAHEMAGLSSFAAAKQETKGYIEF